MRNREVLSAESLYSTEDSNFRYLYETEPACNRKKLGLLPFRYRQVSVWDPHFEELCYKGQESFLFKEYFVVGHTAVGLNYKLYLRSCYCFHFLPIINFIFLLGMKIYTGSKILLRLVQVTSQLTFFARVSA